jgi:hypothetical protein
MPFELWAKETQPDQVMPDWYEWRCENWGTKWDVCEAEIDEDGLEYSDDQKVAWFSFRCWTAWGPPVPVWDRLHAMGIEVEAEYQDEGMNFEGAYRDGEDKSWEPEEEAV